MTPAFVCIGAAHWDVIAKTSEPLPPGADVPGRVLWRPGGVATNVALHLAATGAPTLLLSAIGADARGDALCQQLTSRGIDCSHVTKNDTPTGTYLAIEGMDGSLHASVADCQGLEASGSTILSPLTSHPDTFRDARIIADGNLSPAVLANLISLANDPTITLLGASPTKMHTHGAAILNPSITLYVNRLEAEAIQRTTFATSEDAAISLVDAGAGAALVTDGPNPATYRDKSTHVTASPARLKTQTVTGAGDIFAATHINARNNGLSPKAAINLALETAARHITGIPT